jgi:N-acylglucosamine-6-phosphate 2-epimerase
LHFILKTSNTNMPVNFRTIAAIDSVLAHRLVVSCQPVDDGPMDRDDIVAALARAAIAGGAGGVRIEGARRVAAVRQALDAPIIGIVKRDLSDSPVRITPFLSDVEALANAGADIIAVDATNRIRPETIANLLNAIKRNGALAMADCSSLEDATQASEMGFDIVGTTLSGYISGTIPIDPDYALISALKHKNPNTRIMAEGRFNRPDQAAQAISAGAWAVTVGTAITRTEIVTEWFVKALPKT